MTVGLTGLENIFPHGLPRDVLSIVLKNYFAERLPKDSWCCRLSRHSAFPALTAPSSSEGGYLGFGYSGALGPFQF